MPPDLRHIRTFKQLVRYLEDELGWPLEGYDVEDLTYDYEPDEIGLKPEEAAKVKSIRQLRPLSADQPWGIFFIEFEKKQLPVVVLRRILSHLVIKKRATAGRAERAAWHADDLLFISAFGQDDDGREIGVAHFHQDAGDLPTLRLLGWDAGDTALKLGHVDRLLHERLHWRESGESIEDWRKRWTGAFRHRVGHVIKTADLLAERLAALARGIRDSATELLEAESARGPLTKLFNAFRDALIHDLTPESFADTYAQTITYGLFTAAVNRTDMSGGAEATYVKADDMALMARSTSPFLKEMLETFLHAGGRKNGVDFDELGVQDIVELLRGDETDLPAILRNFGDKKPGEDPVIHFYEHFLSAYNKQLKVQRGVFYTPQPVVSYIVRSVHELLRTEFGLEDGLASTITWGEFLAQHNSSPAARHSPLSLPPLTDEADCKKTISADEFFVQILDPATGTATFLVEVIDTIFRHLKAKWDEGGAAAMPRLPSLNSQLSTFNDFWNEYVPKALLPRLHGYELLAAPYAIAHLKLGLKLTETGYHFDSDERARIYLTNALEPWQAHPKLPEFDALAHEAAAVNEIKRGRRFTVVVGNPPYSALSSNLTPELRRIVDPYRSVNGARIQERSMLQFEKNIQDDYVKFLALSQRLLKETGIGLCVVITNHSYFDGPTLRGVRWNLLNQFSRSWVLDLHGNTNKAEEPPEGKLNENVFDIKQGVAIAGFLAKPTNAKGALCFSELWGSRAEKYKHLSTKSVASTPFSEIRPKPPFCYFAQPDEGEGAEEWETWPSIADIFTKRSTGTESGFDDLLVAFTKPEIEERVRNFSNPRASRSELAEQFDFSEGHASELFSRRKEMAQTSKQEFKKFQLRAYDYRYAFLRKELLKTNSFNVMLDLSFETPGLVTTRQTKEDFAAFAVGTFCGHKVTSSYDRSYIFPLFTVDTDSLLPAKTPCVSHDTLVSIGQISTCSDENELATSFFQYAMAVMNSPSYRKIFRQQLKRDFPRIPLIKNSELFHGLAKLGSKLTEINLLKSPKLDKPITEFIGKGREVSKVGYTHNTVWIDAGGSKSQTTAGTTGFRGVPEDVWNFHIGGYQVCEKWLKDRKGRTLSKDDIAHYHKIVIALSETIRLMAEIDKVIDQHGGWPGAFASTNTDATTQEEPPTPSPAPESPKASKPAKAAPSDELPLEVEGELTLARTTTNQEEKLEFDEIESMSLVRDWFEKNGSSDREAAAKGLIYSLGYDRAGPRLMEQADNLIRTAVRRGILRNEGGELSLLARSIADYEREFLKTQFLAAIGQTWISRDEAMRTFARWLGFSRTGPAIQDTARSLINGLLRETRLEANTADQIRRINKA